MLFTIVSLLLSAILMTQADVDDIVSDVTNSKPLSEELFIFDVTSDAPVADLIGALESASVTVRHNFHVLGTYQYFVVVVDDGSDALIQLTFPKGSLVTQYPVEHIGDFVEMVGIAGWNVSDTAEALDDKDLVVVTLEFIFHKGSSTSEMVSMIKAMASAYSKPEQIAGAVNYVVVGRYPLKMYIFVNLDENSLQKVILHGLDATGGPGNNVINVLRLGKV